MAGVTLRLNGREISLTSEQAKALVNLLWDDSARGAVSAAAQITGEMKLSQLFARGIDLHDPEAAAVERALRK